MKSGGSLVLLLGCHLTQSLPGLFLLCSLPQLLSAAAEGSLESSPAKRFRGASPHQLISCAKEPSVAGSFARGALRRRTSGQTAGSWDQAPLEPVRTCWKQGSLWLT